MKTKNIKLWIAALRSGDYKQDVNWLETHNSQTHEYMGNCCLGVACRVYEKFTSKQFTDKIVCHFDDKKHAVCLGGSTTGLPNIVKKWLGINNSFCSVLVFMNDDEKNSFSEIADYIEIKIK